jgi:hypothetical protein
MGRISPEALAAANSKCVALAAAGLLESASDVSTLETKVLCFDEMQVGAHFRVIFYLHRELLWDGILLPRSSLLSGVHLRVLFGLHRDMQ